MRGSCGSVLPVHSTSLSRIKESKTIQIGSISKLLSVVVNLIVVVDQTHSVHYFCSAIANKTKSFKKGKIDIDRWSARLASSAHLICGQIILCMCTQWSVTGAEIVFTLTTVNEAYNISRSKVGNEQKSGGQVRGYVHIDRNHLRSFSYDRAIISITVILTNKFIRYTCSATKQLWENVFDSKIVASQHVLWKCKNCIN